MPCFSGVLLLWFSFVFGFYPNVGVLWKNDPGLVMNSCKGTYMPSGRSMLSKSKVLLPSGWIELVSSVGNLVLLVEEGTIDRAT